MTALDLERTYLGLDGRGRVAQLPVGPDFWETIETNPDAQGTLVTVNTSTADWPHWEMHPKGDEVVFLLDGAVTMIFARDGGEERIALAPGRAVVVPRGVWHRALVAKASKLLFITYGEGTEHKAL